MAAVLRVQGAMMVALVVCVLACVGVVAFWKRPTAVFFLVTVFMLAIEVKLGRVEHVRREMVVRSWSYANLETREAFRSGAEFVRSRDAQEVADLRWMYLSAAASVFIASVLRKRGA